MSRRRTASRHLVPALLTLVALPMSAMGCGETETAAGPPFDATAAPGRTPETGPGALTADRPVAPVGSRGVPTTSDTAADPALPCGRQPDPPVRIPLALRRSPTAEHPLEVVVYGDSIAITLGPAIERAVAALATAGFPAVTGPIAAAPGFGFTAALPGLADGAPIDGNPVFRDWRTSIEAFVAETDPDLFVALVGAWDILDREVEGEYLAPGRCGWDRWYARLLDDAVAVLTARGARLVWLSSPCTSKPTDLRRPSLNAAYSDLARRNPDSVAFVDLDAFACPAGVALREAAAPDGSLHRLRESDDSHFAWAEAAYSAAPWLADQFRLALGLDESRTRGRRYATAPRGPVHAA